jgi:glycosyltransferase involved in cell wall biosynthesis
MYAQLDGFILLTQQMNDVVNPHKKPHMIMEGLVELESSTSDSQAVIKSHPPTILYAGALRKEYGLDALLEGFSALLRPDVRLVVYGAGPYSAEIVSASKADPRIVFGGRIPVTQVMQEQRKAWILVNTRRVEDEFTKYSFPSKILSYMSSGTAVLTTRLPGMPEDYFEHLFLIDGAGAQGITDALNELLSLPPRDLEMRGRHAQEFVLNKKNNVVQTARIIDFALER